MRLTHCNQSGAGKQALFRDRRSAFFAKPEKPEAPKMEQTEKTEEEKKKEAEKAPEKPKPKGVPIDVEAQKKKEAAEKEKLALEAKKKLTEAEQKIVDKFGGAIFEMDKTPGLEQKGYKNQVYVNVPKNPEKFVDAKGQPVPPRIIYHFHGLGGTIGADTEAIMKQVEDMRKRGENVILVMPQDRKERGWKDLDHPDAMKDIQKLAEKFAGVPVARDISIASSSGGYTGVEKVLRNLRTKAESDPEARELYSRIRQIGLMDSAYGGIEEFAAWAADEKNVLSSNYTPHLAENNRALEEAIRKVRGGNMKGITIQSFSGTHSEAKQAFSSFMSGELLDKMPAVPGGLPGEPHIPERSPDALSGKEFMALYERLPSHEERQKLILDQLAKGNVPGNFRTFEKITVDRNGHKVEFMASKSGIRIGTDNDYIEVPMNGPLAKAVADMYGCSLPSKWMVDQMYAHGDKYGQLVPFSPQVFSKEDEKKMRSPEFVKIHNEKFQKWAREHGVDPNRFTFGYFKDVTLNENPGQLTIYAGRYEDGRLVQPYGHPHPEGHDDYSQSAHLIAPVVFMDGKPVPTHEFLKDSDMGGTFGFEPQKLDPQKAYAYGGWKQEVVTEVRKKAPSYFRVVTYAEPAPSSPQLPDNLDEVNQLPSVQLDIQPDPSNPQRQISEIRKNVPAGYGPPTDMPQKVGLAARAILNAKPFGSLTPFEYEGKKYIAVKEWHFHTPGQGPPLGWHPGVSIFQGTPGMEQPLAKLAKPEIKPSEPAPYVESRPAGGGRKPHVAPSSYVGYTPGPSAPSRPAAFPEAPPAPVAPKAAPVETGEAIPGIVGSTLILGDSLNVGVVEQQFLKISGTKESISKGSQQTTWLLEQVEKLAKENPEKLKSFQNAVVLIGTNDIGMGGPNHTADAIFDRIKKIWEILKDHGVKVFACTIPPGKGWENWQKNFEIINTKRKQINEKILASDLPFKVIDLCKKKSEGGVSDDNDPDKLAQGLTGDHLHIDKGALAKIYQRELETASAPVPPQPAAGPGKPPEKPAEKPGESPLAGFEKSPYFEELTKTYNFPEGEKDALKIHVNAPGNFDPSGPTRIVLYALPEGNTIEQTVGKKPQPGEDFHYDIQHIGAQTRQLRNIVGGENIVVAYIQGPLLGKNPSILAWRKRHPDSGQIMAGLIEDVKAKTGAPNATIDLGSHSAGGGMELSYIESVEEIPDTVKRLSFMDSGAAYSVAHRDKIIRWLKRGAGHYLNVICYESAGMVYGKEKLDIHLNAAKVMMTDLQDNGIPLQHEKQSGYEKYSGLNGRVNFLILDNPGRKILHTETVRRNGFLFSETAGTEYQNKVPQFNGGITYTALIQPGEENTAVA